MPKLTNSICSRAIFLLSLASIVMSLEACEKSSRAELPNRDSECPYQLPEEWNIFLKEMARQGKWGPTCEDSACDPQAFKFVAENIQAVFSRCAPFLADHPGIAQCTRNMRRFVPAWLRQHDDVSYGFSIPNRAYFSAQISPELPAQMMIPPAEIVAAIPSPQKVVEAARRNGYRYLTHDSLIDGIRTFIFIPDPAGRYDQWLLLNLQSKKASVKLTTPLSVLVVQKKDIHGTRLAKVRLHFRDYNIVKEAEAFRLVLNENNNGKCYACHTNGVRQLIPRVTPVLEALPVRGEAGYLGAESSVPADFAFNRLMEFNRKLRSYGSPDWDGRIDPEDFGPMLGKAQGCVDCHDGQSRAALNIATSLTQLEKKTYYELSMPSDNNLQGLLERNEMHDPELSHLEAAHLEKALGQQANLIRSLEDSRLPMLRSWLLETHCE